MVSFSFENKDLSELLYSDDLIKQFSLLDKSSIPFLEAWQDGSETVELQTSGSTGIPKKIQMRKDSMRKSAKLTLDYFGLKKGDAILLNLPVDFIAGKMIWVRAIIGGLNLYAIQPSSNPLQHLNAKIDFGAMTPHQVETSLNHCPEKFDLIKKLIIGGAPVSEALQQRLQSLSTICYATYGMTETITHIAVKQLNHVDQTKLYNALPTITFGVGEANNLKINAPHIANGWLETEDIVELVDETHFKWLGRKDFVINSGGVKLFPEVIEGKIAHLMPGRFYITKQMDKTFGEVPQLVLEGIDSYDLSDLRTVLSKIEMPKSVIYIPKFKETGSGKVDRLKS
jgi:O-succinylbenzoic acid--CoA ligase